MSDLEEPPTKVSKYEMSPTYTQIEHLDDSAELNQEMEQEEWLSEGLLTDDDYNPDNSAVEPTADTDTHQSQSQEKEDHRDDIDKLLEETVAQEKIDANIEQTLNSMDNSQTGGASDAELVKKADRKQESDGNDTDDLLRMLEDDDKTKKTKYVKTYSKSKVVIKQDNASSDDDDDYIFNSSSSTKLKVVKNVLMRKYPAAKAVPEESSDESSDEGDTVKKMFDMKSGGKAKVVGKPVLRVGGGSAISFKQTPDKRPVYQSKVGAKTDKSLVKGPNVVKLINRPPGQDRKVVKPERRKSQESDEIINEEEFLEEDDFDLDEDFADESDSELDKRATQQRIMKPEQMDEDMLSDTNTDEASLFDELSSDSDDLDEWFTLDIRTERAGEYLPLLGPKAFELLTDEKRRVRDRVSALQQSLRSLSAGGRQRSAKLRRAAATLANLDDTLRAT